MIRRRNDNTLKWWDNKYAIIGGHQIWSSKKRLQFYDMIATAIPKDTVTILDVGSGFGFGLVHMLSIYQDWYVEGLDFSTKACAEAVVKTHCINMITDNLPGMYDYIISAETLEHFSNPMVILAKMYQAAKKAVILTVPYKGVINSIHIASFDSNSFDKYQNVHTELSPDKHFMLVVIPKSETMGEDK